MRYLHQTIKVRKGATVTVNFDQPTTIYLLTKMNYRRYKDTKSFQYAGGKKEESPVKFTIPADGEWHIIIEKGTYHNPINITASIEVDNNGALSQSSSEQATSLEQQIKERKERNARIAEHRKNKASYTPPVAQETVAETPAEEEPVAEVEEPTAKEEIELVEATAEGEEENKKEE